MDDKKILVIGYIQQKGKTEWEKIKDNLIFNCPMTANPYEYFPKLFAELFDNWLVEFKDFK